MKKPCMHSFFSSPHTPKKKRKKSITMNSHHAPEEDDHESTQIYKALGLIESRRRAEKPPRALSLIVLYLRRSIRKNEKFIQTSSRRRRSATIVTDFHSSAAPSVTVEQYMERIFKYANCSPSCYVVAFLYMDRYLKQVGVRLTSLNVHRLLITAVMLAAKFMDDKCYDNAYYARIGGLSVEEMNGLEMKLLSDLDFRLHVTVETFRRCCFMLDEEASLTGKYGVKESRLGTCRAF